MNIASLLLPLLFNQSVELPQTIRGQVGQFILVKPIRLEGKVVRYFTPDTGLSTFPNELLNDPTCSVLVAAKPGQFRVFAVTATGDKISPVAQTVVIIGDAVDPVVPTPVVPTPVNPPGPKPVDPKPDGTAPIPLPGLRVMVVYDSAKLAEMPQAQQEIIFSTEVRNFLNEKCTTDSEGGKEWRIYPKITDASGAAQVWQDALKRPRQSVPWVVISNGKTGFEGPLPSSPATMIELVKKYME